MNNNNDKLVELLKDSKSLVQKGQFEDASKLLDTLLDEAPRHVEGLYCLAVCQRKLAQHQIALNTLKKIHGIDSKHGRAYQEAGYNHKAMKQPSQAINAFERAVQLNPALYGTWSALAQEAGYPRAEEAKLHLNWLNSLPPELASVVSLMHQEKLHKAEVLCRQFLKRQPHHPEAMRLFAELGAKFQILDDAEFVLEKCLEIQPDFLRARLDYVEVLHRRQKFHKALEQSQVLYRSDPNNPAFEMSLGNSQQATGDYDAATKTYEHVLRKQPDNHAIHLALGHALKTSGDVSQAIQCYQQAYIVKPDFGDAFWSLANLKTYQFEELEIDNMREQESKNTTSIVDQIHLCFALGKAFEDKQDFPLSFEYYEKGNRLKKLDSKYDPTRIKDELAYQVDNFDQHFFDKLRSDHGGVSCAANDPIFIVGLPRAGSTLLEQILASHSQVDGTMELANIIGLAHRFNGRRTVEDKLLYPSVLANVSAQDLKRLGEGYIQDTMAHRQGAAYFIDKMPNNFRHIALIHLILPNAKIIDARREPMACCFSGYKQLFAEGQEFSYGLEDIGDYYCDYVTVMDHWDKALPGKVLRVQHEDVINDLESQVGRMLDFCGLEFEQNCVDFHKSKRAVRTPSSEQVRQPIYKTGMNLWQNYEVYLEPMKHALEPVLGKQ